MSTTRQRTTKKFHAPKRFETSAIKHHTLYPLACEDGTDTPETSAIKQHTLYPLAYEAGTDTVFRNVGY
jgi:hypothetical protein